MKQKLLQFVGAFILMLCAFPASAYDFEVDEVAL